MSEAEAREPEAATPKETATKERTERGFRLFVALVEVARLVWDIYSSM
ncbi:hypothetical protein ACEZDB_09675 [Streptacidiphilus sp. N1-3]|uniref:Preprotein translocase subunit SecE n=1 Tax=Streptacidiphilus alkalitolerans TaxID=3342712 RepID=A0ABV6WYX1_9ACTN